jgi:hypothetical protein
MLYSELLNRLTKFGYGQISRMIRGPYDIASIGKPNTAIYPYGPIDSYPVILENSVESMIDVEIIEGLLRWASIETADFYGPVN